MPNLRRRALAEIRQQFGCHNVQDIAINRVTDERAENNWSLCVLSAGAADATYNTNVVSALHVLSWRKSEQSFEVRFRAGRLTPAGFLWSAALPCVVRP
jgi:hypothetical protein